MNKQVACTPFQRKSVETQVKSAFATVKNKIDLTPLKVVFAGKVGDVGIAPGWTVYVRSDGFLTYGKEEFELLGKKFILVPEDRIIFVTASTASQDE